MAELMKCPFCGGEAELNYYGSESMPFYSVSCKECGCNQETSIHKEAVINAWNNRATEADIRARAIDEFAEKIRDWQKEVYKNDRYAGELDFLFKHIDEIAEQLKGET